MSYYPVPSQYSRSPPPLHHPQPTHPHYEIPEPPGTPSSPVEPGGYKRFSSSPVPASYGAPSHQRVPPNVPYGQPHYQSFGTGAPMQPQMQPHLQQQQPRGPVPPNMAAAWGVDDATAQIGMQFGRSAVAAGQDYVEKNFKSHLPLALLKHQFNVSNSYVLRKLRLVLFPWRHRPWARKVHKSDATGQNEGWRPPREDINSPDLYIPVMAIVTYVMLAALHTGLQKRFNPEMLGVTASKAFAVLLVDFLMIKAGCYFLNISGQGQVVDIFAYSGYKFVGIILTIMAEMLGAGRSIYWAVFFYAFGANAFFLLRSLRYVVLPDPTTNPTASVANTHTVSHAQRSLRINFLFFVAVSQIAYMWLLVRV